MPNKKLINRRNFLKLKLFFFSLIFINSNVVLDFFNVNDYLILNT
jgi:hypothetical protein